MLGISPPLSASLAFLAGILCTLGFKDVYPDLQQRFRRHWRRSATVSAPSVVAAISEDALDVYDDLHSTARDAKRNGLGEIRIGSIDGDEKERNGKDRKLSRAMGEGIESTIGNTPLIRIKSLSKETGCEILGKAEQENHLMSGLVQFMNGAGQSPKDRVALSMITMAERKGLLKPHSGDVIYEGTVGSTGISLATLCRAKGYMAHMYGSDAPSPCFPQQRFMLPLNFVPHCMPSDQATEKSSLLVKLGAVVERVRPTPIIDPMHFVNRSRTLAAEHTADPNRRGRGFFADQFETEANWRAHFAGTGPEIYSQCEGHLDAFVAGAGTGGTIAGVARFLTSKLPHLKIVLADPEGSGLYNRVKYGVMFDGREKEGTRRRHQVDTIVEGIGSNRVTANFEAARELIENAFKVTDSEAMRMARWLVQEDGIFVGSSSAVNCVAAVKLARELGPGHRIVTILCDSGTRHLSKFWSKAGEIGGKTDLSFEDIVYPNT
ncbi:hypothetical protein MMC13_007468 [Lambiella insularis]|nr:hypothetical protein [Lambiella insularis]